MSYPADSCAKRAAISAGAIKTKLRPIEFTAEGAEPAKTKFAVRVAAKVVEGFAGVSCNANEFVRNGFVLSRFVRGGFFGGGFV